MIVLFESLLDTFIKYNRVSLLLNQSSRNFMHLCKVEYVGVSQKVMIYGKRKRGNGESGDTDAAPSFFELQIQY